MASSSSEEQPPPPPPHLPPPREEPSEECLHRTKLIQFFSRPTPIILQNDNGPCPLLAICNVLLLRNQLNLSADISEVSQEKLLSLVAERLIDSNSNVENKDAEYVQNQQQNIADAIDLLPRLATGIDVNIKFRRIDDFEFTRECTIFDLLDIPLYHGWLVDPQDYETAKAIGSKSYNTITRDLVSLRETEGNTKEKSEEDCVDFAAATAATLGVPSPCLSKAKSFDDSPRAASGEPKVKKGDAEEAAELLKVLKLSEIESSMKGVDSTAAGPCGENVPVNSDKSLHQMQSTPTNSVDNLQVHGPSGKVHVEPPVSGGSDLPCDCDDIMPLEGGPDEPPVSSDQLNSTRPEGSLCDDLTKGAACVLGQNETTPPPSLGIDSLSAHQHDIQIQSATGLFKEATTLSGMRHPASTIPDADLPIRCDPDVGLKEKTEKGSGTENLSVLSTDSDSESGDIQKMEATESFTSSLNDSEPIYEGEECILDSATTVCEDREPVYEGEVVLANQSYGSTIGACDMSLKDEMTPQEGELISNFLRNSASQLTFYGLFSLQEGLKERELCVFFRNNHFSTMFKFEGELYLLTTDQGFLNQPDIVWEKLNEVNGDSGLYDGNFKEFRPESHANHAWDASYRASIGNDGQDGSNINSDLQLAIALQQQEFEQQQPQRRAPQQPSASGGSRLITGPQTSRSNAKTASSSPKQDKKSKDTCSIM